MIFKNIDFHNVDHLVESDGAYRMTRVPEEILKVNTNVTYLTIGVELRFIMKSDKVRLILRASNNFEAPIAEVVFGSLPGGFRWSSKALNHTDTVITIEKPDMEKLYKVHKENNLPYNPELVRILLPYCMVEFVDVYGDIEAPAKDDYPQKTGFFYGSSITSGSLSIDPLHSYVYRVSENLKTDYFNLGYPGSAYLEKETAEYIVGRKDWDFAFLELGINMANAVEADVFDTRCREFLETFKNETRPVFVTNIYTCLDETPQKLNAFRDIVRKYAKGNFYFIEGTDLMSSTAGLSADFVHPNTSGVEEITQKLTKFIGDNISLD